MAFQFKKCKQTLTTIISMQPSVSIIIPVYNVEDYIEDCLKSVISQTYQGKIECIIVDDCTPDNSCKKIEEILSTYTGTINFKIIHHEKNKGLSDNTLLHNFINSSIFSSNFQISPFAPLP